jgi:catechol 2,3-dioxygenase-like lactoylglutathione lyase family enzyme
MKTLVKRTTLIVRDIAVSVRWYEQVLGMTRYYDDMYTLGGDALAAGKEGDELHLVIMQGEHPEMGMIGLMQWVNPPLPAPADIPTAITYGNPTFVLATDDCEENWRRAKALGTRIHADPHDWNVRVPNGDMLYFRGTSLFDPDGHFFQLNQAVPPPR